MLSKSLDEAKAFVELFQGQIDQVNASRERDSLLTKGKQDAVKAVASLPQVLRSCDPSSQLNEAIAKVKAALTPYLTGLTGMSDGGIIAAEESPQTRAVLMMMMDPKGLCEYTAKHGITPEQVKATYESAIDAAINEQKRAMQESDKNLQRVKALHDAWQDRVVAIETKLEKPSNTAQEIAGNLGWIIAVFCVFALAVFAILRWFPEKPQMELISSGQMIQFATVMVLLIVICVLGMSKFITDSTLGTLLGGIGGYVLSQGIGRAERHATQGNQNQGQPRHER